MPLCPSMSRASREAARRRAEARPIRGRMGGGVRLGDDEAAFDQPLQSLTDRVRWKIPLQRAGELAKTLSAFCDRTGERAIERAVQKELAVLGIEAQHIVRQKIDGEVRREARNVCAVVGRNALATVAGHEPSTRPLGRAQSWPGR